MRKAEQWPAIRGRLKMYLDLSDRIFFRKVTVNGIPESVEAGNAGKPCMAIIGNKEIEGMQKTGEFRGRGEYRGLSVDILQDDIVFSCEIDSRGYPASLGLPNVGKEVTIIIKDPVELEEDTEEVTDKADKIKKLTKEFIKKHEQLNMLAEQIKELEET